MAGVQNIDAELALNMSVTISSYIRSALKSNIKHGRNAGVIGVIMGGVLVLMEALVVSMGLYW